MISTDAGITLLSTSTVSFLSGIYFKDELKPFTLPGWLKLM